MNMILIKAGKVGAIYSYAVGSFVPKLCSRMPNLPNGLIVKLSSYQSKSTAYGREPEAF